MYKVAFYGSLRPSMYNFTHFNKHYTLNHKGIRRIEGWNLYSLGSYPYITKGEGTLVVDLFEIDEPGFRSVDSMEIGAGYQRELVNVDGEDYTIYTFPEKINDRLVPSGDWVEHIQERKKAFS